VGAGLLLMVSLAVWMLNSGRRGVKVGAWALVLLTSLLAVQQLEQAMETSPVATTSNSAWRAYNAQEITAARAEGQAVFIDYTAAWCITCQVNKKLVLDTYAASELFEQHNVLRIRADWTRYDENITEALAALNRNSVPVYVYYPANNGDTKVLPQLLTIDMIRDLFP
jgi:thiol:disulfide interchange protein